MKTKLVTSLTPVLALYFPGQLNIFDHPPSSLERWKHTYISTLKHTVNLSEPGKAKHAEGLKPRKRIGEINKGLIHFKLDS